MVIYVFLQYLYQLGTMTLCIIWLRYKYAALIFLTFIFLIAAHNGAIYYVDYYGKHLQIEVAKLRGEIETLQQATNSNSNMNQNDMNNKVIKSDKSLIQSIPTNYNNNFAEKVKLISVKYEENKNKLD